jgi:hypothetical protein
MLRRWALLLLLCVVIPAGLTGCYIRADEGRESRGFRHDDDRRGEVRRDDDRRGEFRQGYSAPEYPRGYYTGPAY